MALGLLPERKPCVQFQDFKRERSVDERIAYLSAFADAIAAGRSDHFARLVKGAYRTGASREELLVAVKVGLSLAQVAALVMIQAHAAIDTWYGDEVPPGFSKAA
jgi:alkylhydroperoxidase/carboxymuconolactone decarboxylase family protein YurZ